MRSNMISSEGPEFMTRIGVPVPMPDFGHAHPFAEGGHTARLREASAQKGCGRRCTWRRTAESADSPFDALPGHAPRPKSAYARPFGASAEPPPPGGSGARGRPKSAAPRVEPPWAVSGVHHANDFNKSSTKHQLGRQVTNRFYNSIGGWSAARS